MQAIVLIYIARFLDPIGALLALILSFVVGYSDKSLSARLLMTGLFSFVISGVITAFHISHSSAFLDTRVLILVIFLGALASFTHMLIFTNAIRLFRGADKNKG